MIGRAQLPEGTLHDWVRRAQGAISERTATLFAEESCRLRIASHPDGSRDQLQHERSRVIALPRATNERDADEGRLHSSRATEIWSQATFDAWWAGQRRSSDDDTARDALEPELAEPLLETSEAPSREQLSDAVHRIERCLDPLVPVAERFVELELEEFCRTVRRDRRGCTHWRGRRLAIEVTLVPSGGRGSIARHVGRFELTALDELPEILDEITELGELARARRHARPFCGRTDQLIMRPAVASLYLRRLGRLLSRDALTRSAATLGVADLGRRIAAAPVSVCDDPEAGAGVGSRPFDEQGRSIAPLVAIQDGSLRRFLLHSESARRLGLADGGRGWPSHAGMSEVTTTNLILSAGTEGAAGLQPPTQLGLELVAHETGSFDERTGTFSDQLWGFARVDGERVPVSGIRLRGSLLTMFQAVEAVGSDRRRSRAVSSPSLWIRGFAVGG
ncbi:MAG: hypothetical protein KC609_07110 [Myxococcales bacterium]|nr:hypothetical protein [Myxococcales bacterium]